MLQWMIKKRETEILLRKERKLKIKNWLFRKIDKLLKNKPKVREEMDLKNWGILELEEGIIIIDTTKIQR